VLSVEHSVKKLVAERLTLSSAALGKACFDKRHSAKRPTLGKASNSGSVYRHAIIPSPFIIPYSILLGRSEYT
jgi:hypothetical protein